MRVFPSLIVLALFFLNSSAWAGIQWSEPEVVPERLVRPHRRVLRFSGVTSPGAMLRIRNNQIKLFLNTGKVRNAQIPQKNKIQFPVAADGDGQFTFDLYLPTVAVEIPVEVKEAEAWRLHTLNFRVPDAGAANDFQAIEESFRDSGMAVEKVDSSEGYYTRSGDQGQIIKDRLGKEGFDESRLKVWGGAGISYFRTAVKTPLFNTSRSGGTVVIPSWRVGVDWNYSRRFKFKGALRSSSGSTEGIGDASLTTGDSFNWLEAQFAAIYFPDFLRGRRGRMGLDFGLQMQSLPFFRPRPGFINEAYFDNDTYNLHIGIYYQNRFKRLFDYEMTARYLYPISAGDAFDIESTLPLNFEFVGGIKRPLTKGLTLGIYGQFNNFMMDVSFPAGAQTAVSDLTLMLFTVDVRLIGSF